MSSPGTYARFTHNIGSSAVASEIDKGNTGVWEGASLASSRVPRGKAMVKGSYGVINNFLSAGMIAAWK